MKAATLIGAALEARVTEQEITEVIWDNPLSGRSGLDSRQASRQCCSRLLGSPIGAETLSDAGFGVPMCSG